MLQPFQQEITAVALTRTVYQSLSKGRQRPERQGAGPQCDTDPVPFNIILWGQARSGNDSYTGLRVRVSWSIGGGQIQRTIFLTDQPKRISGRAVAVEIEAALYSSSDAAKLIGAIAWDPDAGTEVSGGSISNLVISQALSFVQATLDSAISAVASLSSIQSDTRVLTMTSDALSGGASIVPVQVIMYGSRYVGSTWVRLGSFIVDGVNGDQLSVSIPPSQYDQVGYQVVGFPTTLGGAATLQVVEELDPD